MTAARSSPAARATDVAPAAAGARPAGTDPQWPDDAVEVGRIVDAWGLKGWFKVQPFAADPQAIYSSRRWFLLPPERSRLVAPESPSMPLPGLLKITQTRDHGDVVVALAQEVPDRAAAEALRGARVFVARSSFPTPQADEYYWVDLIGMDVVNRDGVALGRVSGLIDTGPHCVLRVLPEGGQGEDAERLIPFVAAYVDDVSVAERRISVDWGLDY